MHYLIKVWAEEKDYNDLLSFFLITSQLTNLISVILSYKEIEIPISAYYKTLISLFPYVGG